MPGRDVKNFLRLMFLSLLLVAAFLWPAVPVWAEVRVTRDTVRVCLAQQLPQANLVFQGRYRLVDAYSGKEIAQTGAGETWTVANVGGFIVLEQNGRQYGVFKGALVAEEIGAQQSVLSSGGLQQKESLSGLAVLGSGGVVQYIKEATDLRLLDGSGAVRSLPSGGLNLFGLERYGNLTRYRGNVELRPGGNGLTVINELPVEQYLYGVVPAEMPVSFPLEALKSQAVAARSYLMTQMGSYASQGFDVTDNQQNQIYRGFDGEHPQTTRAVDETAGQVLVYRGQPVAAFYHASSGGCTENSEDVWMDALGYIRTRHDPADQNNKYYNWVVSRPADQLVRTVNEQLRKQSNPVSNTAFAVITDLQVLEYTASGQRVKRLLIKGCDAAGNPVQVTINNADRVRNVLGLNSAMFTMNKQFGADGSLYSVVFTGSGLGHGLGMSQWGASGMALAGYNYQDILQYYYTGISLADNYGA